MAVFAKWLAVFQGTLARFCLASTSALDAAMGQLGSHLKQLTQDTSNGAAEVLGKSERSLKVC